jgi:hypothetical protein
VNRKQHLDGFELYEDAIFDDHVESIAGLEAHPFVTDWQRSLLFEIEAAYGQPGTQAGLVRGLHQSRAELPMHLDECANHGARPILKLPVLPSFLCHPLASGGTGSGCCISRKKGWRG